MNRKRQIYELPMDDKFNNADFKKQQKIIKENKTKMKTNNPPRMTNILPDFNIHNYEKKPVDDKFDPYVEYLTKKGIADDSETNIFFDIHYINIDSSKRNKTSSMTLSNTSILSQNPLSLLINSSILTVNHPNHNFSVNDQIVLKGLTTTGIKIRLSENDTTFYFSNGSKYVQITYNNGIDQSLLQTYDISDLTFTLSGFVGNTGQNYINNIPINSINKTHNLLLSTPDITIKDVSTFYFELPTTFIGSYSPVSFNVELTFNYIGGIPLNKINSYIPTSNNNLNPYLTITSTTTNSYTIVLSKNASETLSGFGGNTIQVGKITSITQGFYDPNSYIYYLPTELYNVIRVEMFSSEFPCVPKNITSSKNRFYWQNLFDGDYVYYVELDSGFYNPEKLKNTLEEKIYNTVRNNYETNVKNNVKPSYTNHNFIEINIETTSGITVVNSYIETKTTKPIINVFPAISTSYLNDPIIPITNYVLTIFHEGHGLTAGTKITIQGAIQHMGIPASVINVEHTITSILSENEYKITLDPFNLSRDRTNTMGGANVSIYSPNSFRLRMDFEDSLCGVLGFRNIGSSGSITNYGITCSNDDLYDDEQSTDDLGVSTTITKDPLDFISDTYLMINCNELQVIEDITVKDNYFVKILLNGNYGSELYNTFVNTPKNYYVPIDTLRQLTLSFYRPNGNLFDFSKINHSFTLRIVCIRKLNIGTYIDTTTGIEA